MSLILFLQLERLILKPDVISYKSHKYLIYKGKILIREDKVMVIRYPDGTVYTTHKDGTRFLTSADSNTVIIEHNGIFD